MKIVLFFLMFFVSSALLIVSNNNLAFIEEGSFETFSLKYVEWVGQIYLNFQGIVGNVIGIDWLPE